MDRHTPGSPIDRRPHATASDIDPEEFAEFLRVTRERRQISLSQVANLTKIAPRHLAALERGDVRSWPGGMYRRAMMRAYAESIGLDSDVALEQFSRAFPRTDEDDPLPPPAVDTPAPQARASRYRSFLAAATAAAVLVLTAVAVWWVRSEPASEAPEAVSAAAPLAVTPKSEEPGAPAQQPATVHAANAGRDAVVATGGSEEPATAVEPSTEVTEGRLVVASDPPGARVTVDGVGWGETPLTIRYLPLGGKRVRLTKQGYVSQERVVRLDAAQPSTTVRLKLRPRQN